MSVHDAEQFSRIVNEHDKAETEPRINEAIASARAFNERLLTEDISTKAYVSKIHELNALVEQFLELECRASGTMSFKDMSPKEDGATFSVKHYDDIAIIFQGFALHDLPITVDSEGEIIAVRRSLVYNIERLALDDEVDEDDRIQRLW
jgi:hypothetical protein